MTAISYEKVHSRHCCVLHGCKYSEADCPVINGQSEQFVLCEDCRSNGIKTVKEVWDIKSKEN